MAKAWSLVAVAKQAIVLYGGLEDEAKGKGDLQSEQFWGGHRVTVEVALKSHRKRSREAHDAHYRRKYGAAEKRA